MTSDELIKGISRLVSLPDAVIRANELLDSHQADASAIGEVIAHDPALSAQLLKLVNSPLYQLPKPVDSVSRAITVVGTNELRSLILTSSATQLFKDVPADFIDMNSFWLHSVYCGLVTKKLDAFRPLNYAEAMQPVSRETPFLIGLLHNVGQLVLLTQRPDKAKIIYQEAKASGRRRHQLEQEVLGFTTAELGAKLLASWHLPEMIWQPIAQQHMDTQLTAHETLTAVLHQAIALTDFMDANLQAAAPIPIESLHGIEFNGISVSAEQLSSLAMDANLESFQVLSIINPLVSNIY